LCVSDAQERLPRPSPRCWAAPWQRCTVHFLHDMLGHVAKAQQPMIAAAIRGVFQAANLEEARERLAEVLERLAGPAPKVAGLAGDG
jgi:transposase-like protein